MKPTPVHSSPARLNPPSPRTTPSKPHLLVLIPLLVLVLFLSLAPILALSSCAERASQSYLNGRTCYPNGLWKEAPHATWRIMDRSYFFTPNLSFGALSFTQAKTIDVAWDLVVGRGGQVALAWVNWKVWNAWVVWEMERWGVGYRVGTAVAFQTTSLGTLGVLAKEWLCFGEKSWARWWRWVAVLGMVLGTAYVLAFPTLMAAMTGYITTYEPYVEDQSGNLVAWNEKMPVQFMVQDAGRLGEGYVGPLVAVRGDKELAHAVLNYSSNYLGVSYNPTTKSLNVSNWETISLQQNTSSTFVFNGTTTHLDRPTLNITFALESPEVDRPSPGLIYPWYSLDASRQGPIVSASYVHNHGSCKPSETYQWGFSYIFLFMVAIFNFVWSCIVVGMWMDTRLNSRMYKAGHRPGMLRSILDVADAIKREIGNEETVENAQEEELERILNESGGVLVVPEGELKISRADSDRWEERKTGWRRRFTGGSTF